MNNEFIPYEQALELKKLGLMKSVLLLTYVIKKLDLTYKNKAEYVGILSKIQNLKVENIVLSHSTNKHLDGLEKSMDIMELLRVVKSMVLNGVYFLIWNIT